MNPLAGDLHHVIAHTRDVWEELRGGRIFITGGTGFFGCWVLESLAWANRRLELDVQAVVLSRDPATFARKAPHLMHDKAITFHRGDVRDFEFPAGSFSHVIHAATEANVTLNEEAPLAMFDTIVTGTRRTLEFAAACGARKFLLTSSGAVYGKQPPELTHVTEDHGGSPDPVDPAAAYGEGKRAAELLCAVFHRRHGIETKIARCFAFVGPYLPLDSHFAIGNFVRDALRGGPIEVKGDGTPYRSYMYASDLAIWLWTMLVKAPACRPYNVGSDEHLTIAALAHKVAAVCDVRSGVKIARVAAPDSPRVQYVPSVERARRELGLSPLVTLDTAIKNTFTWSKART